MADQPAPGAGTPGKTDRLTVERLPGERGPVLRCFGELTHPTADALRRELALLLPMGHAVVTVNLRGCDFMDVDGLMVVLEAYRGLRERGGRMALVADGVAGRLLQVLGIAQFLPVFPREEVAALAIRGAGPGPTAPATWEEARAKTLRRWEIIEEALAGDPEQALTLMTMMFALCDRSEELFEHGGRSAHARCVFCPLFRALGGRDADFGCRSALDPVIEAVRAGDIQGARARIGELRRLITEMPLPEGVPEHHEESVAGCKLKS